MGNIKIGDVVVLKSDEDNENPLTMTVEWLGVDDGVTCVWASRGEIKKAKINANALVLYEE